MNILLDTHVLLWWLTDNPQLSREARAYIADSGHPVYVSSASVWEISIKKSIGKLKMKAVISELMESNNFTPLPISIRHAEAVEKLEYHHYDPFDRMLIAQAMEENLLLITHDSNMLKYKNLKMLLT